MESNIVGTLISVAIWIGVAAALGAWGKNRKIGFWPAFITGLLFIPLSVILILVFGPKEEVQTADGVMSEAIEKYQQAKLNNDQAILAQFQTTTQNMSLTEKLEQLKQMKADGLLNDQDYNRMKTNLLVGK